jgi:hypothetical protein
VIGLAVVLALGLVLSPFAAEAQQQHADRHAKIISDPSHPFHSAA